MASPFVIARAIQAAQARQTNAQPSHSSLRHTSTPLQKRPSPQSWEWLPRSPQAANGPRPADCCAGCVNPAAGFHHKRCPNHPANRGEVVVKVPEASDDEAATRSGSDLSAETNLRSSLQL
eukprot:CAMPEP_0171108008 /NCGR_PEP_ID=MMETSP0766_2-20121228/67982_1 /TAXON_ID=439317 /ORGANISM="Gambierdiscus australes, Strain CAWD 149" /LENGTH=120 /DNA_ID=CAMNT_0011569441 /DNA_START=99 /DNA_END=461 /DNA_ORIENTATION=+